MDFERDPAKARANLRKHGVPFPFATRVFLDEDRIERQDTTDDYGEDRWITIGLIDDFEIVVAYALRGERIRIISARKANVHEREAYWNR